MRTKIGNTELVLIQGDITQQDTEAIVNAANRSLLGGGGVDGAIHRTGGPAILAESRRLGGCATGDAKITAAGRLKARYVIHAVGPVYASESPERAAELLSSAYRRSLEVADDNGVASLAFPSIATGAYGYPMDEAAEVALGTVAQYLKEHPSSPIRLVRFVLYGQEAYGAYTRALARLKPATAKGEERSVAGEGE
jgi:O-acetyl-ADP-ribose deacetylase